MFCKNCGEKVVEISKFCSNCGVEIENTANTVNTENSTDKKCGSDAAGNIIQEALEYAKAQSKINDMLEIVESNKEYFREVFKLYEKMEISKFNWCAFLFGFFYCVYRKMPSLGKRYFLWIYILDILLGFTINISAWKNFTYFINLEKAEPLLGSMVLAAVASLIFVTITIVSHILLGANFNKEYYNHCKNKILEKDLSQISYKEKGTSLGQVAKWFAIFTIINVLIGIIGAISMVSSMFDFLKHNEHLQDADYYEDELFEEDDYHKDNLTEEELQAIFYEQLGADEYGGDFFCEDFDNNGTLEAFATSVYYDMQGNEIYDKRKIYYINDKGNCEAIPTSLRKDAPKYLYWSTFYRDERLLENGNEKFFVWEENGGLRWSYSHVFGVKNGKYFEAELPASVGYMRVENGEYVGINYELCEDPVENWEPPLVISHYFKYDSKLNKFIETRQESAPESI